MAMILNPYLSFDGSCREAMEFYANALHGTLEINTFGESGASDDSIVDKIMHAKLETPRGFTLMASDVPPGMPFTPGASIAVSLSGDDDAELRSYWAALGKGATITVPLEKQPWGDVFGMLTDRFGIGWMVNITQA